MRSLRYYAGRARGTFGFYRGVVRRRIQYVFRRRRRRRSGGIGVKISKTKIVWFIIGILAGATILKGLVSKLMKKAKGDDVGDDVGDDMGDDN